MRAVGPLSKRRFAAAAALAVLCAAAGLRAATPEPRRVLILSSFGSKFAPFDSFAAELRTEIVRAAPGPVEFLEVPIEMARFEEAREEGPFVEYLEAVVANRHLDLVVTVGGPAASLVARHHATLFASVPTLIMGLDRRQVPVALAPNQLAVAIDVDPPAIVANILRVLPETNRVAVVLGNSPLERFWRATVEREVAPYAGRVTFEWFSGLGLDEMRRRAAQMPPHSAILYGTLVVDAAGVSMRATRA